MIERIEFAQYQVDWFRQPEMPHVTADDAKRQPQTSRLLTGGGPSCDFSLLQLIGEVFGGAHGERYDPGGDALEEVRSTFRRQ